MKKIIKIFIYTIFVPLNVSAGEFFLNPGIPNGEKVLVSPYGKTSHHPSSYCALIHNCTLVYGGCSVVAAKHTFAAKSSPDGVCKALGFSRSTAKTFGPDRNAFGQNFTINKDGAIVRITNKKIETIDCRRLDPAERKFVYVPVNKRIITSIICE